MTEAEIYRRVNPAPGGCMTFNGPARIWFRGKVRQAVRVVWWLLKGELPPARRQLCRGVQCRTPGCVNPDHLQIGVAPAASRRPPSREPRQGRAAKPVRVRC